MRESKLKLIFGFTSAGLLSTLLYKLSYIPGGMILSGLSLGGIIILVIIIGCIFLSKLLKQIFRKNSFLTLVFITTSVCFVVFHYKLYSPTLTIVVPDGYRGEVNLVLSNMSENNLAVDSNGIGYLTEWTFDKTYSRPIVIQENGKNLDEYLIGFNISTFFGRSKSCCVGNSEIQSLSFKIGTKPHLEDEYFDSGSITELVNKDKTLFTKLGNHTTVQTEATINDNTKK